MLTKDERINIAIQNAEIGVVRPRESGGQSCGLRKISKKSHKSLACVAELRYKYNNYF